MLPVAVPDVARLGRHLGLAMPGDDGVRTHVFGLVIEGVRVMTVLAMAVLLRVAGWTLFASTTRVA